MLRILVFGDSIAYGAWDSEGGWVQRLRKFLESRLNKDCLIYNLSISGDTSEKLLKRFESEAAQRAKHPERTVIIFAIGINDSQFLLDRNTNKTEISKFAENVRELINKARKLASVIIFLGLTPVDEAKTTPVEWDANRIYRNEHIKAYENALKEVCAEQGVHFIELFDRLSSLGFEKLLEDGVHPNSEGHEILFRTVRDFLVENKLV